MPIDAMPAGICGVNLAAIVSRFIVPQVQQELSLAKAVDLRSRDESRYWLSMSESPYCVH